MARDLSPRTPQPPQNETDHLRAQVLLCKSSKPMTTMDTFDKDRMYRIQLGYPVPADPKNPNGCHIMRPSDRISVTGEFAETIKDAIISAVEVG